MVEIERKTNKESGTRKFYRFDADIFSDEDHGTEISNYDALITPGLITFAPPPPYFRGFAKLPEVPHLVYNSKEGRMPRDMELMESYRLVSQRFKDILTDIDQFAFEFVACDFTLPDGSKGPQHYLCDLVRTIDAIDEGKSKLKIIFDEGKKIHSFLGGASLVFKTTIPQEFHAFKTTYRSTVWFCDDIIRTVCQRNGMSGIVFEDIRHL